MESFAAIFHVSFPPKKELLPVLQLDVFLLYFIRHFHPEDAINEILLDAAKHKIVEPVPFVLIPILKKQVLKMHYRRIRGAEIRSELEYKLPALGVVSCPGDGIIGGKNEFRAIFIMDKKLVLVLFLNRDAFSNNCIKALKIHILPGIFDNHQFRIKIHPLKGE